MAKKLPPIHPGEILREEFLLPLKLTPYVVAATLTCRAPGSSALRGGKSPSPPTLRCAWQGLQDWRCVLDEHAARFDFETAEDVLAPQIKKIASYGAV